MLTSSSNITRLRSGDIGSMRAWFPSRRSTAHQRGAWVIRFEGHVRSGRSTTICSWKGRYLCTGIADGFWVFFMMGASLRQEMCSGQHERRDEKARSSGLVTAAKKKQTAQRHAQMLTPCLAHCSRDAVADGQGISAILPPGCPDAESASAWGA